MSDSLTEKIQQTLIRNGLSGESAAHLASEIVATFRQHRMNLPVIRTADQRIEQEIRERGRQINTRKRAIAFLASLRRKASHE
jgi:hypothetical protein